ncbi:MAG: glycosyltransferase [bacterium]|nr:glycosyltransferase [bacterium]
MKLFVYDWNFIVKHDLYLAFSELGIEYDLFSSVASPRFRDQREQFQKNLKEALEKKGYDALFSINYFSELADAAREKGIPYICWTYDSPALGAVDKYDTSYFFIFDSAEYEEYKGYGVKNMYYLPLAVNTKRLSRMQPAPLERMKYHADVSFVGQLYQSDMDRMFPLFDEYGAGYTAAMINTQMKVYGSNIISDLVNENVIRRLCNREVTEALLENLNNNFYHDVEEMKTWALTGFLLKAVTNKERVLLLTLLAKYCRVKLFTVGEPKLPNVTVYGTVDYVRDMPLVFKCSRINLNVTLRNIRHGIPQRVLDIMGCGALALTNYQEDIGRYFQDGRDLLVYSSTEEALEKSRYYLAHEKEAEKIRQNGYRIVRDQFSYQQQLDKIWELTGLKAKLAK